MSLHADTNLFCFTGFGKCVPNKQTVIFSKMTLLATTSSTTEKKISQQGFRMSKFRMPVNAVSIPREIAQHDRSN